MVVRRIYHHKRTGRGFFDFIKKAHNFIKNNQIVSKAANVASQVANSGMLGKYGDKVGSIAGQVGAAAAAKGYGRRRRRVHHGVGRRRRVRRGGSKFTDFLSKANNFLRDHKVVSTVANALGSVGVPFASKIGSVASNLGYGRKRVHRRKVGGAMHTAVRRTTHRMRGGARHTHVRRGRGVYTIPKFGTQQYGQGIAGLVTYSSGTCVF